jgi:hypothetical protein
MVWAKGGMKMGNIYALQGKGKIGKTTTLKLVFEKLEKAYKPKIQDISLYPRRKDITVILNGIKGETIGIESAGDDGLTVDESLFRFEKAGCTIIFCACRSKGGTVDSINKHKKYTPNFIRQESDHRYTQAQQDQNNDLMAQIMIKTAGL